MKAQNQNSSWDMLPLGLPAKICISHEALSSIFYLGYAGIPETSASLGTWMQMMIDWVKNDD